ASTSSGEQVWQIKTPSNDVLYENPNNTPLPPSDGWQVVQGLSGLPVVFGNVSTVLITSDEPIPTLGEWGLIILGLGMAIFTFVYITETDQKSQNTVH
ncbi:MAG: IPTL-CTERM sorting domain-containing protein, partial [Bacteroidota bacterium]